MQDNAKRSDIGLWLGLFLALLLTRLPFVFTGNIQTDAYISWRCASNLDNTGVYGYNPGEASSASTSHLYVLLSAGFIKVFGASFIPFLLIANGALFILGAWFLSCALFESWRQRWPVWALVSLMPVSFQASTTGMETSLLLFIIGLLLRGSLAGPTSRAALVAAFLLPWTRPDAIAYGGIVFLFCWYRDKKTPWLLGAALVAGVVSLLLFNDAYFGHALNQTIIGKATCYKPRRDLFTILSNLREVFAGKTIFNPGIYCPFFTHFFIPLREVILSLALFGFWAAWRHFKSIGQGPQAALLILLATLPPAAYAVGGVLFYWYLWPAAVVANVVFFSFILNRFKPGRAGLRWALVGISIIAGVQWVHSFKDGGSERFLRDVGLNISKIAKPGDTLFLEPAGTPVFYSKLYCWDSIGLTSPTITDYEKKYGTDWYMKFLEDFKPTYILLSTLHDIPTCGASLDAPWFNQHYKLRKEWIYDPANYFSTNRLVWSLVDNQPRNTWYLLGP